MTTTQEALRQVATDRERIAATTHEIASKIEERVATVKRAADPRTHIRAYPWIALAAAFSAGVAIAVSKADRAAAHATADAAKAIGSGATELVSDVKDRIQNRDGDEPDPLIFADGGADKPIELPQTVGDRILGVVDSALYRAFEPVLREMKREINSSS